MTKIGTIDYCEGILDALRDDNLVVFAGAGVSMGSPSNLPSFDQLAQKIASGTGKCISDNESIEQFLGRLKYDGIRINERAVGILSPDESKPSQIHIDLTKLFRSRELVRIVTTNYDNHFEEAAGFVFSGEPPSFNAPALPLGKDFKGVIHIHGDLRAPDSIVLTDADFGRAYLTEGWASRFLLDMFQQYTVLFVGYSYGDVVMNYLSRALPVSMDAKRYILTDSDGKWDLLGIKPLRFKKNNGPEPYRELNHSVHLLAERVCRGALDWQTRLAEVCVGAPPTDEEAIDEVLQALRETFTTRFFVNAAADPEWLTWLNLHNQINGLFSFEKMIDRDQTLAIWIAEKYVINQADKVLDLIVAHNLKINSGFWWLIIRELKNNDKILADYILKRWVAILLASKPDQVDSSALLWLAERCAKQNAVQQTLMVFLEMCIPKLSITPGFVSTDKEENQHGQEYELNCSIDTDNYSLSDVWTRLIKPNLEVIAQPLLMGMFCSLEKRHQVLASLGQASRDGDLICLCRSAIEPHEQNWQFQDNIDVLIDAARDTFEWLATNSLSLLEAWIEIFAVSDVPLLRRLAIHAIIIHPNQTPDERLVWLINRIGLFSRAEHHEIYRVLELNVNKASDATMQKIYEFIFSKNLMSGDGLIDLKGTARAQFDLLSWINKSKPDNQLIFSALEQVKQNYPDWVPSENPDLSVWIGQESYINPQSPLSVEQLLNQPPEERIDYLLSYNEKNFNGPDREGLVAAVRDACIKNKSWAFSLSDCLKERKEWSSDLWTAIFQAWQKSKLIVADWKVISATIIESELDLTHAYDVACLLFSVVSDESKQCTSRILNIADNVAIALWNSMRTEDSGVVINDWVTSAINHPAGIIVEFWLKGLAQMTRNKSGKHRVMPLKYRRWFELVLQDLTSKGGYGRTLLASQTTYLWGLNENWTVKNIIPLFTHKDDGIFIQSWSGFLTWGKLNHQVADALIPAFESAVNRIEPELHAKHKQFVNLYTSLAIFHVQDPMQNFIPLLLSPQKAENAAEFASWIAFYLKNMEPELKRKLWDRWLCKYWNQRLLHVPVALSDDEISNMLNWLPILGEVYPEAVPLAVQLPGKHFEHCRVFYELIESELVIKYPIETAELLIYLCRGDIGYHTDDVSTINDRLSLLPSDLRHKLDDTLARIGVKKGLHE